MSGLIKGIKKIFKAVVKVVKKLLPIILIAGVAIMTGGFGLAGMGAGGAAAGAAGAAGGAAAGGGFLSSVGGWLSSLFGGGAAAGGAVTAGAATTAGAVTSAAATTAGTTGLIGKILASPITGKVIAGAGSAYLASKGEEDAFERDQAQYKGAGDAASFDFQQRSEARGLGVAGGPSVSEQAFADEDDQDPNQTQMAALDQQQEAPPVAYAKPKRPSADSITATPSRKPRFQYNPETGRIVHA